MNRLGARLVGIRTALSGQIAFLLAAVIGATSGILIVPITTLYYDTGFLIGLKGFVAAIIGGLISYPLTAIAALLVGTVESFSSFYASNFKEVIVFALIIPVLLLRSLAAPAVDDEKESGHSDGTAVACDVVCRRDGGDPVCAGHAAILDRIVGQYRAFRAGCDGTGDAHRRRRPDVVRPGGVLRFRRLHLSRADDHLRPLAMADAATFAAGEWRLCGRARTDHREALRPLSAARHPRLGPRSFLPLQQTRIPRPQRWHLRHPAACDWVAENDQPRHDLFRDLERGHPLRAALP